VGHNSETLAEIHAKTDLLCQAENCLDISMDDLPQEFIDKAILSFQKREFDRVLLQLVDILNIN